MLFTHPEPALIGMKSKTNLFCIVPTSGTNKLSYRNYITSMILNFQFKPYSKKFPKLDLFKLTDTKEYEPIFIKTKEKFFTDTCLNTFIRSIKGTFGLEVRSMRPTNLQEAFEWAIKERDIYFQENKKKQVNKSCDRKYGR